MNSEDPMRVCMNYPFIFAMILSSGGERTEILKCLSNLDRTGPETRRLLWYLSEMISGSGA